MTRSLFATLILALAACGEPPRAPRHNETITDLQDCWKWDATRGAEGPGDPYQGLLSADPNEVVQLLIKGLTNGTKTKIDDHIHGIPTVGDLCFHLLLSIFSRNATEFERDGVYILKNEELAIYGIAITKPETRVRLQQRFLKLASERGWTGEPK